MAPNVRRTAYPVPMRRWHRCHGLRARYRGLGLIELLAPIIQAGVEAGGAIGTAYVTGSMSQRLLEERLEGERELLQAQYAGQQALARTDQVGIAQQLDFLKSVAPWALAGFGLYLVFK